MARYRHIELSPRLLPVSYQGQVHLPTSVLTPLRGRSRLVCKERRNSSNSGTHLRQTGGFFVPVRRCKPT